MLLLSHSSSSLLYDIAEGGNIMEFNELLRFLGICRTYRGCHQLQLAVRLVCDNPERLCCVTADVYKIVAAQCNCSPSCVERNIRTIIFKVWKTNKHRLCELFGYDVNIPPTAAEFIDILAFVIKRNEK